jgi:hypothetical protein
MSGVSTGATQGSPAVADVDGDGLLEIVFGDEQGLVHGYNHDGTLTDGFPIQIRGEVRSSPALWDVDSDNLLELAVYGFDTNLYVWDLPFDFNPNLTPWPFFRHDTRNTGWVDTEVLPDAVGEAAGASPRLLRLHPAMPNPMGEMTRIAFELPHGTAAPAVLAVYDAGGRLVRRLYDGPLADGRHQLEWDGRTFGGARAASGIYFIRLELGSQAVSRKLTLVR